MSLMATKRNLGFQAVYNYTHLQKCYGLLGSSTRIIEKPSDAQNQVTSFI